jgi:hypothetical protein
MGLELAFLWVAEAVMFAALGCFVLGFRARRTDLERHKRLGKLGALLVLAALLAVELVARVLRWEIPVRSEAILRVHIRVATVALAVLIALVWTGMRGPRRVHVKLYLFFFPLYVATLVLSLLAFDFT